MTLTRTFILALALFALLLVLVQLIPVAMYIVDMFHVLPDGMYNCDPGNDWLVNMLPIIRATIKAIGIRIAHTLCTY